MNERILKALMQLFSIVADVDDVSGGSRKIVQTFLNRQLNKELVEEYLILFDKYFQQKHYKKDGTRRKKSTSANSVKVLLLCTQINQELTSRQKIIVLIGP